MLANDESICPFRVHVHARACGMWQKKDFWWVWELTLNLVSLI